MYKLFIFKSKKPYLGCLRLQQASTITVSHKTIIMVSGCKTPKSQIISYELTHRCLDSEAASSSIFVFARLAGKGDLKLVIGADSMSKAELVK